jgi:hypothetical protein
MGVVETPSTMTDEQRGRAYLAQTDLKPVESISSASERDRLQREIDAIPAAERGVSFFSGRPVPASQLVPVSMVVGGRKRTVTASVHRFAPSPMHRAAIRPGTNIGATIPTATTTAAGAGRGWAVLSISIF